MPARVVHGGDLSRFAGTSLPVHDAAATLAGGGPTSPVAQTPDDTFASLLARLPDASFADKEAIVKKTFESRKALITDRVRTIVAQSDPEKLGGGSEPGLETLRRQVKYQLDEIVGEGVIEEVLVPRCIPFRTDY